MLRVCVAGKNAIAVNAVRILLNRLSPTEIAVIPNASDSGVDSWQPSFLGFARENHLRILTLEEAYEIPHLLFLSLEFDRIIKPQNFLSKRLFNLHFSKLPKFKGVYTSIMPILCGESESGVTLHMIDSGIDTGAIVSQKSFEIGLNESARDLYFKYLHYATLLFSESVESLLNETFSAVKQGFAGSYYSRKSLDFSRLCVDLQKTSFEIHNQLRAFIFKEYQLPKVCDVEIEKSVLTDVFVGRNCLLESATHFILSGIDGFQIKAYKALESSSPLRGGGIIYQNLRKNTAWDLL